MQVHSAKVEPEVIIDSGSTISLMKDEELLEEIHECKKKIIMEKNYGTKRIKEEGTMPDYGMVYYDSESMTNIFSISDTVKKGNHMYIKTRETNFLIVTARNRKDAKFPCNKRGLHAQ